MRKWRFVQICALCTDIKEVEEEYTGIKEVYLNSTPERSDDSMGCLLHYTRLRNRQQSN